MEESRVIHEITPLMGKDSLYIADRRKKEFTYPIHNHEVFELNFVEHAPGVRRIVGDSNDQLMGISWGALAGAFLAPFMLGLYWRGVTTSSVWACFTWGVGLTVVNMLLGNPINPINCGAIAMVGGFPVVWIVSLLSKKMDSSIVNKIFECYK